MRKVGTGLMFAFGLSVALAAQSTSTSPAQSTNPNPSTSDAVGTTGQATTAQASRGAAGQTMTIVGCLQRGSGAATAGTTGAAGGATASATTGAGFILTNAARGGESATTSAAGATTGAAGTTGAVASTYMLEGSASDLTPHVGHKIEVTGSARPAAASATTPGATDSGARAAMSAPRFDVTAVKMIAAECGPAGR